MSADRLMIDMRLVLQCNGKRIESMPSSTAVFIATFDKFVCSYSLLGVTFLRFEKGGKIQILVKFCNHVTGIVMQDKFHAFA